MMRCWFYRFVISRRAGDGTLPAGWVAHHLDECADCRDDQEAKRALTRRLAADAALERRPTPTFLHGKIMRAVRAEVTPRAARPLRRNWAMALGAACLVAVVIIGLYPPEQRQTPPVESSALPGRLSWQVTFPSTSRMGSWAEGLNVPLERENELVLLDAKAALQTLAAGFVPDEFLSPSRGFGPR